MIDLPLLVGIQTFQDGKGTLRGDRLRCAVLAASIVRGRAMTYGASMDLLREMGQQRLVAFDEKSCTLLAEGEGYLQSAAQSGEWESYKRIIDGISSPPVSEEQASRLVASLSRQVAELMRSANARTVNLERGLALGAILVRVQAPPVIYRLEYTPDWTPETSTSSRWRDAHQAAREWRAATGSLIEVAVDGDLLIARSDRPDCQLSIHDHSTDPAKVEKLPDPPTALLEEAASRSILERAVELGWRQTGSSGRAFFNPATEHITTGEGGPLREYDAFSTSVSYLGRDEFLLWIDEFVHHVQNAQDYIEAFGTKRLLDAAKAGELQLRTAPYGTVGELETIRDPVDVHLASATGGASYYEYWADKYGIELEFDLQPVLLIKTKTGSYSYPAELVRVDIPSLRNPKGRDPKVRSPRVRLQGIRELSNALFADGRLVRNAVSLTVLKCVPSLEELRSRGQVGLSAVFQSPPFLLFGEAVTGTDPIEIFDRSPFAGNRDIIVDQVFWPDSLPRQLVETFLGELAGRFARLRLGRVFLDKSEYLSYKEPGRKEAIASIIRPLRRTSRPAGAHLSIAIVGEDEEAYQAFKRYYPDFVRIPIQSAQSSTVREVAGGDRTSLDLLALNCYLKVLGPGDPAWALAAPAGNRTDKTAFLGIGFSRRLNPRKTGKAAVALHDSRGFGISWTLCVTPGVEKTIDRAWFQMLLDQLMAKWDLLAYDRVIIFRRGRIDPVELTAIREELATRSSDLRSRFKLIAVVDSRRRFFRVVGDSLMNPEPGTVLFLTDGTALVAASGVETRTVGRGTIVPVELSIALGDDDLRSIAQEYLDLTYLSWSNPYTTWKDPLVLKLADRIAALVREGVPENAIFYLPL